MSITHELEQNMNAGENNVIAIATDKEMWQQFLAGNEQALSTMFTEHYDALFFYGLRFVQDENLVKDCIQDLFLKLWRNRSNLSVILAIKPYLLKSLRRLIIDFLKSRNRQFEVDLMEYTDFSPQDLLEHKQNMNEGKKTLLKALNSLSPRQKEAISLKFYNELNYDQIAQVMEVNVQSVRNLIHQGVKNLRAHIKPESIIYWTAIAALVATILTLF